MRARSFRSAIVVLAGLWLAPGATQAEDGRRSALELVMVERQGCAWCLRWTREVGPIFPKTAEGARAPLRRHDLARGQPEGVTTPAVYTPTFVLMRAGCEVGRIVGYVDDSAFWGLLGALLAREDEASAVEAAPNADARGPAACAARRG